MKIEDNKRETFNEIIRLIIKDAQKGLHQFHDTYGKIVIMAAKNEGCNESQSKSVENKVLIKLWRSANKIKEIKNPEGWIYTVARNCAKDELKFVWHLELNENICKTGDDFEGLLDRLGFEYLISFLNDEEKELFTLKFVAKSTFQDIADIFGKPLPTITSIYYRAKEKIKKSVKDKNLE